MARYRNILPMVDSQENSFNQIQAYLKSKKFKFRTRNGEQVFQKGDGFWTAARFIKVTYSGNMACVEAWVDVMGEDQDLEGFSGSAAKKPLKKIVAEVEAILSRPGAGYVPQASQSVSSEAATYCVKCGTELAPGSVFCPSCSHMVGQPYESAQEVQLPEGTTENEYYKHYAGEGFNKSLKSAAIVAYICAGLNAALAVALNPLGLLDSLIFLGIALGMHLGKNKICAYALLGYAIFTVVVGLVMSGTFSGWLWLVAGITAVTTFRNAKKRYKQLTEQV